MTQGLATSAGAGGLVVLLLVVMASRALDGAAGGRGHQPMLVAGLLSATGFVVCRRAVLSVTDRSSRCRAGASDRANLAPRSTTAHAL